MKMTAHKAVSVVLWFPKREFKLRIFVNDVPGQDFQPRWLVTCLGYA